MKKKILVSLLIGVMLLTAGCASGVDGYKMYGDAVTKTNEITSGEESFTLSVKNTFDYQGMSELKAEELKMIGFLESINIDETSTFDRNDNKSMTTGYIGAGGIGVDFTFLNNGENAYLYVPMFGKYIDMNGFGQTQTEQQVVVDEKQMEALSIDLSKEFIDILNSEDIVKGEKTYVETPEGKVKSTIVNLNVTDAQIKSILTKVLDRTMDEDYIKKTLEAVDLNSIQGLDKEQVDKMKAELTQEKLDLGKAKALEFIDDIVIDSVVGQANIDFDGYIVKTTFQVNMHFKGEIIKGITQSSVTFESNLWNIDKKPKITFPEIGPDQIMTVEDLQNMDFGTFNIDQFFSKPVTEDKQN